MPLTVVQLIPFGAAPAGLAARADTPAIGTMAAAAAAAPIMIRFFSTLVFSFI